MRPALLAVALCTWMLCLQDEVFAVRAGPFEINPSLTVTGGYTDNVFNTNSGEKSDYFAVITPGIKVQFPQTRQRFLIEMLGEMWLERYSKYTSQNSTNYRLLGDFKYKAPGGLEFIASEEYIRSHDLPGTNLSEDIAYYRNNKLYTSLSYVFSDRYKIQAEYTNLLVKYDDELYSFENRAENTFASYLYYRFQPKTAVFAEYEYALIEYEESDSLNSREYTIYGGLMWDLTAKTKGTIKGGYLKKKFSDSSLQGFSGFVGEGIVDHSFTPRHTIKLRILRQLNETNVQGSNYYVTMGFILQYFQRVTTKITVKADLAYGRDRFYGGSTRTDNTWKAGLSLMYQMRKWLQLEAAYLYTNRDSSDDQYSYRNSSYYLKASTMQ